MQTHAYSSPSLKAAGTIIDMTAAAHIDRGSPEPGNTATISFRSPEPITTMGQGISPEPGNTSGSMMFASPEPGNTGV